MRLQNPIDLLILVVACEALVQLWFHAAPLQPVRGLLKRLTPFLHSRAQESHLLDCPYCLSVWMAAIVVLSYAFLDAGIFMGIAGVLTIHRLSNFVHLIFSCIRDKQLDIRIARGKSQNG